MTFILGINGFFKNNIDSFKSLNYNVKLVFTFSFLQSFGRGIWMGNVLSAFIYFLAGESHQLLGWTSAASGVAMTLVVFPSGYVADRYRRDTLLRLASVFGFIGIVLIALANSLLLIFLSLISWGLTQGLARPALEAILADSVESGARSNIYSKLHLVRNFSMAIGPFINVFLFIWLGDVWELTILKIVMYFGLGISLISIFILNFFSDDKSLKDVSEAFSDVENIDVSIPKVSDRRRFIPLIIVSSNLIIGMGAGMTIKYFPIFFIDIYNMGPISVNILLGATAIATGMAAIIAQSLSLQRGRVVMIATVQLLATACLFLIAFYPPIILLVGLFIWRGSLMNASQPLSRSILMDYVPKKNRGKWNSVEALAWGLFWNASAVVGGYLIEAFSYRTTFLITGVVYIFGTIPIFLLLPLVADEKIKKVKDLKVKETEEEPVDRIEDLETEEPIISN